MAGKRLWSETPLSPG